MRLVTLRKLRAPRPPSETSATHLLPRIATPPAQPQRAAVTLMPILKRMMLMAKVLVVTSGKGGVGKTTSTAALGAALAQNGQRVALVDFDVGLRNLDLIMGAERRVVYDLINVIKGDAKLE